MLVNFLFLAVIPIACLNTLNNLVLPPRQRSTILVCNIRNINCSSFYFISRDLISPIGLLPKYIQNSSAFHIPLLLYFECSRH